MAIATISFWASCGASPAARSDAPAGVGPPRLTENEKKNAAGALEPALCQGRGGGGGRSPTALAAVRDRRSGNRGTRGDDSKGQARAPNKYEADAETHVERGKAPSTTRASWWETYCFRDYGAMGLLHWGLRGRRAA